MQHSMNIIQFKNKCYKMNSCTELVNSFNFLNFKKILSMKDMEANKEYLISGAYKTQTKYGMKIVLKLEDSIFYLPARFISLGDEAIMKLSEGGFSIAKKPLNEAINTTTFKLELKHILPNDLFYSPYVA